MNRYSMPDPARWAPWWVLAFVALWPLRGPAEVLLSLGAIATVLMLLWRRWHEGEAWLSPEAWALSTLLFVAYWLPQPISALDAVNPLRSLREAALDLRYLPFLWLATMAMARAPGRRIVGLGLALIVAAWTADALLQAATGWSLGGPVTEDRLSGIFGSHNLKLGLVLASLSPFVLEAAADRWRFPGWLVAALALGVVVLLAGARAGWVTLALVLLWSGWRRYGGRRTLLAMLMGGGLAFGSASLMSEQLQPRIERTAAAMQGDWKDLDHALSGRLSIWRVAVAMSLDHPFNGVGVRGFRDAYGDYRREGEPPFEGDGIAFHAHQIVLEILSETGSIGLLLWLSGALMAWRAWRVAGPIAKARAQVPMMALAVTVFPFNTHHAFYSTFWGGLTLLLAALYVGSLLALDAEPEDAQSE
ncbi:MAG TPA: O-antigen ligase [Arenimonas sp.]|nr:O-antigen ligase [Arenimonas sp.]